MPINSSDLLYKYSIQSGNQEEQDDPTTSIGGFISDTVWFGGLESLFDDITESQNESNQIDYRCIFLHNTHQSLTLIRPVAWIYNPVLATIVIGVDPAPPSPIESTTAQAAAPASRYIAPSGVTFVAAQDKKHGLVVGNLPPGMCKAIWIKRTAPGTPVSSPNNNAKFTLRVAGDTLT